jgi:hypothetical protein
VQSAKITEPADRGRTRKKHSTHEAGPANGDYRELIHPKVSGAVPACVGLAAGTDGRPPWWLWWNILSVDAPTVSVVWAILFAECYRAKLSAAQIVALTLAIWTIYAGDRLLDGWRSGSARSLRDRHLFSARHRTWMMGLVALAGLGALWVSMDYLNAREETAGVKLSVVVGLYLIAIHGGGKRIGRFLPKELFVGGLFAAGTALPVWYRNGAGWRVWLAVGMFALLCALNCLSIESWECEGSPEKMSRLVGWAKPRIDGLALALGVFSLLLLPTESARNAAAVLTLGISLGSLLILLLNRCRRRFSRPALRVLVDVALVTAGLLALTVRI